MRNTCFMSACKMHVSIAALPSHNKTPSPQTVHQIVVFELATIKSQEGLLGFYYLVI